VSGIADDKARAAVRQWIDQLFDEQASLQNEPAAVKLATHSALASAKLAAALSDDDVDEIGMTIAYLKRGLKAITMSMEAGAARRGKASRDFAASASQQLVWVAASRLKAGLLFESARVTLAGIGMYPLSMGRNILSLSTLRSLKSGTKKYWRSKRTYAAQDQ